MSAFPYNLNNLIGGQVRVLYAPISAALPAKPGDIFGQVSPYNPVSPWRDFGGGKDAFNYEREFDVEGWEIQQATGNVIEEPSEITRTVTLSIAELTPEAIQIIEEAPAIETIAASANNSSYKKVSFGLFEELTQYRIAFVARRKKASGLVTEPGGVERGRYFVGHGYRCQLAADGSELEFEKGELTAAEVAFTFFPEPGRAEGVEHGDFFEEQAGTISAV